MNDVRRLHTCMQSYSDVIAATPRMMQRYNRCRTYTAIGSLQLHTAHTYAAIRSLPLHTHMHSDTIAVIVSLRCSDMIAVIAHTYTAVPSLPLHTHAQRYHRCHCTHMLSDTIAGIAHTYTAIQSLPSHTHRHRDHCKFVLCHT